MSAGLIDLDALDGDTLAELARIAIHRQQAERHAAEERTAALADLLWGPTIAAHRTQPRPSSPPDAPPAPPRPATRPAWTDTDLVLCAAQCADDRNPRPLAIHLLTYYATKYNLTDEALDTAIGVLNPSP